MDTNNFTGEKCETRESLIISNIIDTFNNFIVSKKQEYQNRVLHDYRDLIHSIVNDTIQLPLGTEISDSKVIGVEYLHTLQYNGDVNIYDFLEFLFDNKKEIYNMLGNGVQDISDYNFLVEFCNYFNESNVYLELFSEYNKIHKEELELIKRYRISDREDIKYIENEYKDVLKNVSYRNLEELLEFLLGVGCVEKINIKYLLTKYEESYQENYLEELGEFVTQVGAKELRKYLRNVSQYKLNLLLQRNGIKNFEKIFGVCGYNKMIILSNANKSLVLHAYMGHYTKLEKNQTFEDNCSGVILKILKCSDDNFLEFFLDDKNLTLFLNLLDNPTQRKIMLDQMDKKEFSAIMQMFQK